MRGRSGRLLDAPELFWTGLRHVGTQNLIANCPHIRAYAPAAVEPSLDGIGRIVAAPQAHAPPPQAYAPPAAPQATRPLDDVEFVIREPQHPLPAGAFGSGLQHARDVGAARALKVLPANHTINSEESHGIVTDRPYNAAPPPATDWDAPAPYKGNLAMLLQAMIATEDGPAAALAASMMAETNTPMAPVVA